MNDFTYEVLAAMDVKSQTDLYSQLLDDLHGKLPEGFGWETLAESRKRLTHIGVALNRKLAAYAQ